MSEIRQLLATLKRLLKREGKTYRDVAEALGVSEPSVKRLFASGRFSLERLVQVCDYLGFTLNDLVQEAAADRHPSSGIPAKRNSLVSDAERELYRTNQMLQLVLDHIPQRIFWKDKESRFLGCNRQFAQDAGLESPDDLIGKNDYDMPWRVYAERLPRKDGSNLWVQTNKMPLLDLDGTPIGILGTFEDVTDKKMAEHFMHLQASAMESSINGIFMLRVSNRDALIEYVNGAFQHITGYTKEDAVGKSITTLGHGKQDGFAKLHSVLSQKRPYHAVTQGHRKDGTPFWNELSLTPVHDESGDVTHYVGILNDVTERVEYQKQIERQANYDALTGLPNRNLLQERVGQAMRHADRQREKVGVALIDLDHFKYLNDSHGYQFGDALLKDVAGRLQDTTRSQDTAARIGEDAFVLLLCGHRADHDIALAVERVRARIAEPVVLDGHETNITCTIGVSIYADGNYDGETLLRNADIAMYRAKEAGRNRMEVFHPDMTKKIEERLLLERAMRKALDRIEFLLQYQPQIDLHSGRIVGAEALVRWMYPGQGMIMPSRFIPIAEDSDLIVSLGDWVLRTACKQGKAWRDAGLPPIMVSVNISVRQFKQAKFVDHVIDVVRESGMDPQYLELELTESMLMTSAADLADMLDRLKNAGIKLAIDDFGTGYSSLSYLKRLPVDKLKIDQSFVRDVPRDRNDVAIVNAIIALARSMELTVLAEGVETKEQLEFLREQGCDGVQGYFFSHPVAPEAFAKLLEDDDIGRR
ncbi:MAG: domain S-box protein [Paucimonas sp.]|nr:domain S-box protein [Paucimonas sp.]